MDRREFALSIAKGAAVVAVGPRLIGRAAANQPTPISALDAKAVLIDSLLKSVESDRSISVHFGRISAH